MNQPVSHPTCQRVVITSWLPWNLPWAAAFNIAVGEANLRRRCPACAQRRWTTAAAGAAAASGHLTPCWDAAAVAAAAREKSLPCPTCDERSHQACTRAMPCATALYRVLACRNADHPLQQHRNAGLCACPSRHAPSRNASVDQEPRGYAHAKVALRLQNESLQEVHLLVLVSAVSSRHVQRPGLSGRCKPLLCTGTTCCCCCRWWCCCCCCSHGERLDWERGVLLVASAGQQRTVPQAVACGYTVADAPPQDTPMAVQDPRKSHRMTCSASSALWSLLKML